MDHFMHRKWVRLTLAKVLILVVPLGPALAFANSCAEVLLPKPIAEVTEADPYEVDGIRESIFSGLYHFILRPQLNALRIQAFVKEHTLLGRIQAKEFEDLQFIYRKTGNQDPGVTGFLKSVRSYGDFRKRLEWHRQVIEKADSFDLKADDILDLPGNDHVLRVWHRLRNQGWTMRYARGQFSNRFLPVSIDLSNRVIRVSLALDFTPLPLLIGAHLYFLDTATRLLNRSTDPTLLKSISRMMKATRRPDQRTPEEINRFADFLVARESMRFAFENYERLVEGNPFFRVKGWEYLRVIGKDRLDGFLLDSHGKNTVLEPNSHTSQVLGGMSFFPVDFVVLRTEEKFLPAFSNLVRN